MKVTKKALRAALAPMSRALLSGKYPEPIMLCGLRVSCKRSYQPPGRIGPAWSPDFSILDVGRFKQVVGGSLTNTVDALYVVLNRGYYMWGSQRFELEDLT